MSGPDPVDQCYEEILREHSKLRTILDELKQLLFDRAAPIGDVAGRLTDLQSLVSSHFKAEEASGCFPNMVSHAPRVSSRVEDLIAEHGELNVAVNELVTHAAECAGGADDWELISVRFTEFTTKLMQHEMVENELMQEVFTEDIGSKD